MAPGLWVELNFIDGGAFGLTERQRSRRRGWNLRLQTASSRAQRIQVDNKVCVGHGFEAPVELLSGDGW